jgi:hypothetical protein
MRWLRRRARPRVEFNYETGTMPIPMQDMKVERSTIRSRPMTPEENVQAGLAYIRRSYLDSGSPGACG